MRLLWLSLVFGCLFLPAVAGASEVLSGRASLTDGDTLEIGTQRIRLHGIDAPEAGQTCTDARGGTWPCGTEAIKTLASIVEGKTVQCEGETRDDYSRLIATCFVGGLNINEDMVRRGMAWAFIRYAQDYVGVEADAQTKRIGIWQAPTEPAWDYRARRWEVAKVQAPEGCPIKGNVNRKGERIYHTPWSPWYDKINMKDTTKGKMWFCTEAEALAAGWRPASWK
jgi:endonuclease YncB( thermonuclease family)